MAEQKLKPSSFVWHLFAALGGVVMYAVIGSMIGWENPIWWGGEALFPALLSASAVLVGAIPFHLISRAYLDWRGLTIDQFGVAVGGFLIGISVYPALRLVSAVVTQTQLWASLTPMVAIWLAVGIAWLLSAAISLFAMVALRGYRPSTS